MTQNNSYNSSNPQSKNVQIVRSATQRDGREAAETKAVHNIILNNRAHMEICGVRDVISFDDNQILLVTDYGELEIGGEGMHISVLDVEKGNVVLDGTVNSVYYNIDNTRDENRKSGFFSRLLR